MAVCLEWFLAININEKFRYILFLIEIFLSFMKIIYFILSFIF